MKPFVFDVVRFRNGLCSPGRRKRMAGRSSSKKLRMIGFGGEAGKVEEKGFQRSVEQVDLSSASRFRLFVKFTLCFSSWRRHHLRGMAPPRCDASVSKRHRPRRSRRRVGVARRSLEVHFLADLEPIESRHNGSPPRVVDHPRLGVVREQPTESRRGSVERARRCRNEGCRTVTRKARETFAAMGAAWRTSSAMRTFFFYQGTHTWRCSTCARPGRGSAPAVKLVCECVSVDVFVLRACATTCLAAVDASRRFRTFTAL
jgi:hypothetical protein